MSAPPDGLDRGAREPRRWVVPAAGFLASAGPVGAVLLDHAIGRSPTTAVDVAIGAGFGLAAGLAVFLLVRAGAQSLRREGTRYRALFDNSIDAILVTDPKGVFIDANEAACALFEMPRDRLIGASAADLRVRPGDTSAADLCEENLRRGRGAGSLVLIDDSGSERLVEYRTRVLPNGRQVCVLRDLTDRAGTLERLERTLVELRQTRDRLASLLDAGARLQTVDEPGEALGIIARAIRGAGWDAVAVNLFDESWRIVGDAYAGLSPERIADLRSRRVPAARRAAMFGPERDRFRVSRSYFIPSESRGEAGAPTDVQPGGRAPRAGDTWKPEDLAYVPLVNRSGRVVGRITVDDPVDGRRPDEDTFRYVESFADLAARTIENLRLVESERLSAGRLRVQDDILESISEAVLVLDRALAPTYLNGAAAALFGDAPAPESWLGADARAAADALERAGRWDGESTVGEGSRGRRRLEASARSVLDERGEREGVVAVVRDVTERRGEQERLRRTLEAQRLLLAELDHRVKNALGNLMSMIDLAAAEGRPTPEFAASIRRRLEAMARVHSMLSSAGWGDIDLEALISALRPPETPGAVDFRGPEVFVPARQATAFGSILDELFSNSLKHGSLGASGGAVVIRWSIADAGALELEWREVGGPTPHADPPEGLGTRLIKGFAAFELRGGVTLRYEPDGARHTVRATLDPAEAGVLGPADAAAPATA